MSELPERPPLKIQVGETQVKMTYGLEMDLRRLLPDPETAITLVMTDPFTQDYVVRRCLSGKKGIVTDLKELDSVEVDLDPDETEALLVWAVNHVLYFFMKRVLAMGELATLYNLTPPTPSNTGSENSASTTPSAGPTE